MRYPDFSVLFFLSVLLLFKSLHNAYELYQDYIAYGLRLLYDGKEEHMGALCYPCGGMAVPYHLFLFQGQDNTAR